MRIAASERDRVDHAAIAHSRWMPSHSNERASPSKFRPRNTLASPRNPTFTTSAARERLRLEDSPPAMVNERDTSRTSSGHYLSPTKPGRLPLANISAKMQSPSPKPAATTTTSSSSAAAAAMDTDDPFASLKPAASQQAEFGKASPLRNPLVKKKVSPSSMFVPKKPVYKPAGGAQFMSSAAQQAQNQTQAGGSNLPPPEQRGFYMPGQRPGSTQQQPTFRPPGQPPYQPVHQPYNPPPITSHPPSRPQFSSLGPNTYYQPFQAPKSSFNHTKNDDDEGGFDVDAALRAEGKFGAPDPNEYMDAAQANENLKNLLEGAFEDDGGETKIRLRRRAKKAAPASEGKEAKSLAGKLAKLEVKAEPTNPDPKADEADPDSDDDEDGTVDGLTIKLLPHQVAGVAWMIDKESGQPRRGVFPHGGILADDMGLGKTIQALALLLTNPHPGPDAKLEYPKQKLPGKGVSNATLVVAPLALIKQWEAEIKTKVAKSHALRVLVHHGASRTKSPKELAKYDVVITTYQTLTSEHAGSSMLAPDGLRVGCMGVRWYRVILDEAHSIKNRNAKSTQACYALESWYRWCLSGTPMQNNLDELQSLIKFLRIKPFCELARWKADIAQP
ncbi:hypothetical protein LTR53_016661, partial [Teratosphaeriaceae sp. CCFEE 6253]